MANTVSDTNDILAVLNDESTDDKTKVDNDEETLELEEDKAEEEEDSDEQSENEEEVKLEEDDEEESDESKDEDEDEEVDFRFNSFNKKKFLKEFPDAFKKYPGLEKGYYTYRAYQEEFPTVKDATEAREKLEFFENHQNQLNTGNSVELFKSLKEENPQGFNKLVNNYLGNLKEVDSEAYVHIISGILEDAVLKVFEVGDAKKDDDLKTAAQIFGGFLFGDKKLTGTTAFKPKDSKTEEVDQERERFLSERRETFKSEVKGKVDRVIGNTISKMIDPNERMTPFIKKQAIREASEMVQRAIELDPQLKTLLPKLWKDAEASKFDSVKIARIEKALLSKGQVVLPEILRKVRQEALSGTQKRGQIKEKQRTLPKSGNSSSAGSKISGADKDKYRGLSTRQILEMD